MSTGAVPDCPFPSLAAGWPYIAGYTVRRLLGCGGMGSVFAARPPGGGAEVALKIIDTRRAGPGRERWLVEARAAAAVVHPRLLPCLDLGEFAGLQFLVMPLMSGGDGDDLLVRHHRAVPVELIRRIARGAAEGLEALHLAGIVHRDLKPSNLLFDAAGGVQLADFGLACMGPGGSGTTRVGFTVGTPDYMAPEQAKAQELDGRADLYALGATLYQLAVGQPPHQGTSSWVVLGAVITEPFPDPLDERPELGHGLAAVIRKLGAKDREERYQNARQFLDDLDLVEAGRAPVHARFRSSQELVAEETVGNGPRVLLIDDDPLVRRIYVLGLEGRGIGCQSAPDGASGLALARIETPSCVIVDLVLPDLSGVEVVRRLRLDYPELPIFVLSNAFVDAQLQAAQTAGASKILVKSQTPPSRLSDEIRSALAAAPQHIHAMPQLDAPAALSAADAGLARVQVLLRRLEEGAGSERLLAEIAATARGLSAATAAAALHWAAQVAAALEALARELLSQPDRQGPSTRRTMMQAATALRHLLVAPAGAEPQVRALAVDDDRMARLLVSHALNRVSIPHDICSTPVEALGRLAAGGYDLLLTDVSMDGLSGFQLAARVRALPACQRLPILFVTGLDDFPVFFTAGEGTGTDLIAKPYLLIELGLKALTMLAEGPARH